jgi:hypothetical protein
MKKPKLSRKRCSPLSDIYTPIDKTSLRYQSGSGVAIEVNNGSLRNFICASICYKY